MSGSLWVPAPVSQWMHAALGTYVSNLALGSAPVAQWTDAALGASAIWQLGLRILMLVSPIKLLTSICNGSVLSKRLTANRIKVFRP